MAVDYDVIIIGGGPGGLTAAVEGARSGVGVTILDENPKPGGQIFRQFHEGFQMASPGALGHDYMRGYLNPRPPVRPIPLGVLAGHSKLNAPV